MKREQVARNQRARIYGAMIESVARSGYAATSVADVVALAGVSRRAFYELFSNKEECFLATYDVVVARARKLTLDGWAGERGWANRLHGGCRALLDGIAESPKGPRLVLVDSLGAGPMVRERMLLSSRSFELMVSSAFSCPPDGPELPGLTCKAIVAGVRHVASVRLREGRAEELRTLTDEVLDWCECYRSPFSGRLGGGGTLGEPHSDRGTPAAFLLAGDERARALSSILQLTLGEGYRRLSDRRIAELAGVSTETFHAHFANKEAAFLALLAEIAGEAIAWVTERAADGASWAESVQLAIAAFVDYAVSHEALMRIAFIEPFAVGAGVGERMTDLVERLTALLTIGSPEARRAPLIAREAVAGALWAILHGCVAGRHLPRLPSLVEHLTFTVLAPYLGAGEAFEVIRSARRAPSQP